MFSGSGIIRIYAGQAGRPFAKRMCAYLGAQMGDSETIMFSEGNLFVRMQGGYLRVMYPEPENCLNLPAWQEFFGFDREGQNAWFDIDLDPETGKAAFRKAEDTPFGFRGEVERLHLIFSPEDVKRVSPDRDLPGETRESVLPGPFEKF